MILLAIVFQFLRVVGNLYSFDSIVSFEKKESVYLGTNLGYLVVPENWNLHNGNTVKLAVAQLEKFNKDHESDPILIVAGGPGAGATESLEFWFNHPLRKNHDIILLDVRGTGNSEPRLCPDLGNEFLQIFSKNQNSEKDAIDKVNASLECKNLLISNNIDINAYNSEFIAKDFNALKIYFDYEKWNVYGVSYGTYISQVYASDFPQDISSLILDSPISEIEVYYNLNSLNFYKSLNKVFEDCKNNPSCDSEYPYLEQVFYETIDNLRINPISVKADTSVIKSGEFTFNVDDFLISIQQSLYEKDMIEIVPLLIYQFHLENKNALASFIGSFSGALSLDYGMYYCVICSEVIPYNSQENLPQNSKNIDDLAFYSSDFDVCNHWNINLINQERNFSSLYDSDIYVLIFSGEFDPITPSSNGLFLNTKFKKSFLVNANTYGHAPSYSMDGALIIVDFLLDPKNFSKESFSLVDDNVNFISNIYVNSGVSKMVNSINLRDFLFFTPLSLACFVILLFFSYNLFNFSSLINMFSYNHILNIILFICSFLSILILIGFIYSINESLSENPYIFIFGISNHYYFLFIFIYFLLGLFVFCSIFFILFFNKILNKGILISVLFSNLLILVYFFYWGVIFF